MNGRSLYRYALHPLMAGYLDEDNDEETNNASLENLDSRLSTLESFVHQDRRFARERTRNNRDDDRPDKREQEEEDEEADEEDLQLQTNDSDDNCLSSLLGMRETTLSDEDFARMLQLEEALALSHELGRHMPSSSLFNLNSHAFETDFDDEDDEQFAQRIQDDEIAHRIRSHSVGTDDLSDEEYLENEGDPLDLDNMTYEQLLALGEHIGTVECGASAEEIAACPIQKFNKSTPHEQLLCLVCHDEYQTGNTLRTLPCFHAYHQDCIDKWLSKKPTCPVCQHSIKAN